MSVLGRGSNIYVMMIKIQIKVVSSDSRQVPEREKALNERNKTSFADSLQFGRKQN